jgi:hypothetical protein
MIRGFPGRDRRVAPEVPAGSGFGLTLGLRMAWSRIGAGARRAELSYARVAARPTKGVGVSASGAEGGLRKGSRVVHQGGGCQDGFSPRR